LSVIAAGAAGAAGGAAAGGVGGVVSGPEGDGPEQAARRAQVRPAKETSSGRFMRRHRSTPSARGPPLAANRIMHFLQEKLEERLRSSGKMGYALLWLLGVPIPILLIVYLARGCT
jgi:hypothetical protein